jgi:hypothetical protein
MGSQIWLEMNASISYHYLVTSNCEHSLCLYNTGTMQYSLHSDFVDVGQPQIQLVILQKPHFKSYPAERCLNR